MTAQKKLDLLLEFANVMSKEHEINHLLDAMADYAKNLLAADRVSIFIYDSKEDELWTTVSQGVDNEIRIPADSGLAGYAALSKEIQIVVDAYSDFRFNPEIDQITGYTTKSVLVVPLLDHNDELLGVFQALNKVDGLFTTDDSEMLLLISNYASKSIENALLYSQLSQTQTQLIHKLSSAAEFKDQDTSKHTQRVGKYAAIVARGVGLPEREVELIELTAPMHDAGKLGIPDAILQKPGRLTHDELFEMQKHAQIGYHILHDDDNELLRIAAEIARDHHEKVDGTGYPDGKIGDEISLFGRIVSIVDVFDALVSSRPYKEAWSFEKALGYLEENKGSHFDVTLVEIFMKNIDKIREVYINYHD